MKKFTLLASLTFLFIFASCNFFEAPVEPKNGSIVIDLGKNSRAITFITQDSVDSYSINVSGNGYSETKPAEAYKTVVFEDLEPGTYTVKGLAFSEDNKLLASASTTVTIKALDNVTAKLNFHEFAELSTRFGMFNYTDFRYIYYPYDEIDSLSLDISSQQYTNIKSYTTIFEMPDSKTYIIVKDDSEYKLCLLDSNSYTLPNPPSSLVYNNGSIESIAFLASDPFDSFLSGNTLKYDIYLFTIRAENSINTNTLNVEKYPNDAFPSNASTNFDLKVRDPIDEISKVVVRNSLFIISYKSDSGESRLAMVEYLEELEDGKNFILHKDLNAKDLGFTDTTEIRDICMPKDGELYLLVGENGATQISTRTQAKFSSRNYDSIISPNDDVTIEKTTFYQRGGLVKLQLNTTDKLIASERNLGWYNNTRHLTAKGAFTPDSNNNYSHVDSIIANKELSSLDLIAPTKKESNQYFYGPVRFICTKPDEVYIVDSGFNIRLADWTARDETITEEGYYNQNGLTSNVFNHDRIIKVDLNTFAMSVIKEYNSCIKFSDADLNTGNPPSPSSTVKSVFFSNKSFPSIFGNYADSASNYLGIHPNPVELDD